MLAHKSVTCLWKGLTVQCCIISACQDICVACEQVIKPGGQHELEQEGGIREGYGGIHTLTGYVDRSSLWDHLDTGEHCSATLLSLCVLHRHCQQMP